MTFKRILVVLLLVLLALGLSSIPQETCAFTPRKPLCPGGLLCPEGAGPLPVKQQMASGSGFTIGEQGYLLTNAHVVGESTDVDVTVAGHDYTADVEQRVPSKDLALLTVDADQDMATVPLGDSDAVKTGDRVVAIGCPNRICGTVTQGHVSNLDVSIKVQGRDGSTHTLNKLMMLDLTIAHGSSGGPLFNMNGEVIGITTAFMPKAGFSYAIPINQAIPVLEGVPGFSTSDMGNRNSPATLQEIMKTAKAAGAFLRAESIQDLWLLPEEFMGARLKWPKVEMVPAPVFGPSMCRVPCPLWHYLQESGIQPRGCEWVQGETSGGSVKFEADVYQVPSGQASRSKSLFLDATSYTDHLWRLGYCDPSHGWVYSRRSDALPIVERRGTGDLGPFNIEYHTVSITTVSLRTSEDYFWILNTIVWTWNDLVFVTRHYRKGSLEGRGLYVSDDGDVEICLDLECSKTDVNVNRMLDRNFNFAKRILRTAQQELED